MRLPPGGYLLPGLGEQVTPSVPPREKRESAKRLTPASLLGAGDRSRTRNPLITNQVHYHCATPAYSRSVSRPIERGQAKLVKPPSKS